MAFQKRELYRRTYQVFVPAAYTPETRWPLIVFLNGVGENGSDGESSSAPAFRPTC